MEIVECNQLDEGKTVMIGNIIFVGTKTDGVYLNEELEITIVAV